MVPMCCMDPATTKFQDILQHADGTATSLGWGCRLGPTCSWCTWNVHLIPATENTLFSAHVSTAAGLWHEDLCHDKRQCLAKQSAHTITFAVCQVLMPYQACPIAWVCRALSWGVSVFRAVKRLWKLGPPAPLMCFQSLVSELAEEQAIMSLWLFLAILHPGKKKKKHLLIA